MNRLKTGLSLLALAAMTAQASAGDLCDENAAAALKTAAVQQELMVAGLTCGAIAQYNRFVLSYRPELQASDADLMNYFRNRDGSEAGYDSYKTKVANLSSARSSAYGSRYCQQIARDFAASFRQGETLKDFVAGERLLIAVPESCAVKYDMPEVAVAGVPSYALPASPYGAAPVPVAPVAYNNPPPASRAPQSSPDQGWDDGYSAYGPPPGWLPPRQARRWDWYGHSAYNGYND
jgi:hypothetical protein